MKKVQQETNKRKTKVTGHKVRNLKGGLSFLLDDYYKADKFMKLAFSCATTNGPGACDY